MSNSCAFSLGCLLMVGFRATERPVSKRKRLAGEKTELDIENQPKPLAGPSARKKIQLKPR